MNTTQTTVAELYRLHYDDLLRRARILLHDDEDARDAVSDVLARLMDIDLLPREDKLLAYVRSSVRFECLNRLKRMKLQERMRRALPLDDESIGTHDEEEEHYRQYQTFIQTELTPQTRRVFNMHYGERLKYREIAEQIGISEAAVYKHLSQAITKLKNRFNP
ncbi:MAG: sigma-70 family RNA polymerase sigma factor [Prevotella sp.]|nr:sigma-70 family RNA polymerase sigma factor [Prevotella sp.]